MRIDIDRRILELARDQHGVMTRSQLVSAGATPKMIRCRLASGRLLPLHRGVYLAGALAGPLEPPRAREMAAVLACGPKAVVSHVSAARLWDLLPGPGASFAGRTPARPGDGRRGTPPAAAPATSAGAAAVPVDVTTAGHVRRRRPGIRCHRASDLTTAGITILDGIPVTTSLSTLRDLSTVLTSRALNRAAARAERRGLVTADALTRLADRHAGRPGAPVLRASFGAGRELILTRSEAEERLLDLVRSARLPPPEVNVVVGPYEADFLWSPERLVVEVDGFPYHSSRRRFEADRRRDVELTARGFTVCRLTWRQLTDERDATLARLAGMLASRRKQGVRERTG